MILIGTDEFSVDVLEDLDTGNVFLRTNQNGAGLDPIWHQLQDVGDFLILTDEKASEMEKAHTAMLAD